MGKKELADQDSCLALIAPIAYIIKGCLHIYGMFTRDRAPWSVRGVQDLTGVDRKHPFSPLLSPWYIMGQVTASHQDLPTDFLPEHGSRGLGTARWYRESCGATLLLEK